MTNILLYLVQVSAVFSICYILYIMIFKKLTFHTTNRILLLLLIPLSILIPLSSQWFPSFTKTFIEIPILHEAMQGVSLDKHSQIIEQSSEAFSFSFSSLCILIYGLVVSVYLIRILITVRRLFILRKNAIIHKNYDCQLVHADVSEIFSYFHWIFIPKDQFGRFDKQQILTHEKAHIRHKHSFDVLISEIYIAFFWFNPLLYFYRKSLKSIHEFQADRSVINNEMTSTEYLQLLLETISIEKPNNLYSYFNHPILKKRIDMITKTTSRKCTKFSYLLLLPLCICLISAFAKPRLNEIPKNGRMNFYATTVAPPSLFPVKGGTQKDITSYFGEKGRHAKVNKGVVHTGIDIRAIKGTPVLATADGVISKATLQGAWGNLIIVSHSDGYETWYAHLEGFNVKKQQQVTKGDLIGYVGNTGRSTGPHLHYEVKQHGKHKNPLEYLK